jgi:4-amino-4-deoxy-L-arabinose transferase-like glycosyltransferase
MRVRGGDERWWYIVFISSGLAFMTKSTASLIVPAIIAADLLFSNGLRSTIRSIYFYRGIVVGVLVVLPWHLMLYAHYGAAFVNDYMGRHGVTLASTGIENHTGNALFYVGVLQNFFFPWVYLVPFAVGMHLILNLTERRKPGIMLIAAAVMFLVYTVVHMKLTWYLTPLYPALSLEIGYLLANALRYPRSFALYGLVAAICWAAMSGHWKLMLLLVPAALAGIGWRTLWGRPGTQAAVAVLCLSLAGIGMNRCLPNYAQDRLPVAQLAQMAGSSDRSGKEPLILFSSIGAPAALFYSNRPIEYVSTPQDLRRFTSNGQDRDILLTAKDIISIKYAYDIQVLAEAKPLTYATVRTKAPSG